MKKTFPAKLFIVIIVFILPLFVIIPYSSGQEYHDIYEEEWDDWEENNYVINDPHEDLNRKIFNFNHKLYTNLLFPLSRGYDKLVHKKIQKRIDKIFTNAKFPIRFVNNLFQGKFKGAVISLTRFVINSSVGIGGIFDPAEAQFKLALQDEDFGQTLGHHGFGPGSYFVIPLIGPSSTRDIFGFIGNMAANPFTWLDYYDVIRPDETILGIRTFNNVNSFSLNVRDHYIHLYDSAIDPYSALQHAYIKNREKKIKE